MPKEADVFLVEDEESKSLFSLMILDEIGSKVVEETHLVHFQIKKECCLILAPLRTER